MITVSESEHLKQEAQKSEEYKREEYTKKALLFMLYPLSCGSLLACLLINQS